MDELSWVGLPVIPTFKDFESKFRSGVRGASGAAASAGENAGRSFGTKATSAIHSHFASAAKYIVGPLVGAFAVEKIGELVKDSLSAASDLEGARNRANVIFGKTAADVDRFGAHAAKSLGLSNLAALQAETGFGLLGQRMGLTDQQNARFSQRFTGLADDLAAFNHSDPEEAFTALERGVAGATRGLKPYGVLISSTAIQAEALADGILKPVKNQAAIHAAQVRVLTDQQAYTAAVAAHGKESLTARTAAASLGTAQQALNTATAGAVAPLTDQQKMLAARNLILKQTTAQQGSFKKSGDQLYEQQHKLSAAFSNATDRLGKGLLPVATDVTHELNQHLVPAIDKASVWFEKHGGPAIHGFEQNLKPLVDSALPALATGLEDSYKAGKKLLPVATGIFKAFNSLPGWAQKATLAGGTAAFLGRNSLKAGAKSLLGIGGSTAAGEIASLAKPLPVFVTNEGFGGGGGAVGAAEKDAGAAAGAAEGGAAGLFGLGTAASLGVAAAATGLLNEGQALLLGKEYGKTLGSAISIGLSGALHLPPSLTAIMNQGSGGGPSFLKNLFDGPSLIPKIPQAAQSPHLTSSTTAFDALKTHAQSASREIDLIGPHAVATFAMSDRAVDAFNMRLSAIHDQKFTLIAEDQAAINSLELLRTKLDLIRDKSFTVTQRNQIIEQAFGPGGGQGRPNPGGSGDPIPRSAPHHHHDKPGSSSKTTTPMHVHLHVDKKEIANVVIPIVTDHHDAQQRWDRQERER